MSIVRDVFIKGNSKDLSNHYSRMDCYRTWPHNIYLGKKTTLFKPLNTCKKAFSIAVEKSHVL